MLLLDFTHALLNLLLIYIHRRRPPSLLLLRLLRLLWVYIGRKWLRPLPPHIRCRLPLLRNGHAQLLLRRCRLPHCVVLPWR